MRTPGNYLLAALLAGCASGAEPSTPGHVQPATTAIRTSMCHSDGPGAPSPSVGAGGGAGSPEEATRNAEGGATGDARPEAANGSPAAGAPVTAPLSDCPAAIEQAFIAPASATPIADYTVDRGLTHYSSQKAAHADRVLIENYNWQSKYLDMETWDLDSDPHVVQSDRCVIEYKFSFGQHCFPITLGNYALEKYSKYVAGTKDGPQARDRFLAAAAWFVANQDEHGGWGAEYAHEFWSARAAKLPVGWYSGMAQGLAISVLVRAFFLKQDARYLDAARRAVAVLRTPVELGGVMRRVSGHAFYEEYPTVPMSNVLNGYMFAVIGLYDLSQVTTETVYDDYFNEAIATLKAIVSRYDLGFSTSYDLTHLQHDGAYPNRARWSYHALHVTQLSLLRAVTQDPFFTPLIDRWGGYLDDQVIHEN